MQNANTNIAKQVCNQNILTKKTPNNSTLTCSEKSKLKANESFLRQTREIRKSKG